MLDGATSCAVAADATARRAVLDDISFTIHRGEIVGIAGVEGNGQAELIGPSWACAPPTPATIVLDGEDITQLATRSGASAGIGYIPEDRHRQGLLLEAPLWENRMLGHQTRPPNAKGASGSTAQGARRPTPSGSCASTTCARPASSHRGLRCRAATSRS